MPFTAALCTHTAGGMGIVTHIGSHATTSLLFNRRTLNSLSFFKGCTQRQRFHAAVATTVSQLPPALLDLVQAVGMFTASEITKRKGRVGVC